MYPKAHFPQMLLPRLGKAVTRLQSQIWRVDSTALNVWQTSATAGHRTMEQVENQEFAEAKPVPFYWGEMFDQCWWRVQLPAASGQGNPKRYLRWADQAEATVYVDGTPYYGIDPGHHYAPLPDDADEIVIESLCARTGIWVSNEEQGIDPSKGSRFEGARLAFRNDDAWHAWHDLDVLMGVVSVLVAPDYPADEDLWRAGGYRPELSAVNPVVRQLISRMDDAIDLLDRQGIAACREALQAIYKDFPAAADATTAVLTGHAHIDLVWLWPERAGDFKAVHSFANALRMLEQYPEATFGYSQPASYEAVQRRSPSLMQGVRERVGQKRWEPTGALYVESDVQLPCGEALVRTFALGQAGFRDLRGEDSRCVWIPDVFGYSACLPTIMAGFDVPYFYTTKLHWSSSTRFPYSHFQWVGMDGSTVLSHVSWHAYNQLVEPAEVTQSAANQRQCDVHDKFLYPTGYGDGGGGLTESMCERARRLDNLSSMPRTKWGTIEGFFDELSEKSDSLPSWRGEMYLEFHRGVQTMHSDLKRAFRAAERGLQVWEAVRCATGGGPVDEAMWKRVCFAQFHDYIPGSSIAEVYADGVPELQGIADDALEFATQELNASAQDGQKQDCVFNPLPLPRLAEVDGRQVTLPPLAGVAVDSAEPVEGLPVKIDGMLLSNGHVQVEFTPAGEIEAMQVDGQQMILEKPVAQIWTFHDIPAIYDAWDIERYSLSCGTYQDQAEAPSVESTDESARMSFKKSLGEAGEATVHYRLDRGSHVLRIDMDLDIQQPQVLVKLAFPTGYRGREARYGGPFGSVKRPQWPGPLANEAMFENPASRWVCISDDDEREGLMLISEAKYGFGARDGLLHVSLARSAKVTQANVTGEATSLGHGDTEETYADMGSQHIQLALGCVNNNTAPQQQPAALADTLFAPVIRYQGKPLDAGFHGIAGPASFVPSWAVPESDKAWTLRLHETMGGRGDAQLNLNDNLSAQATDLRGVATSDSDSSLTVTPYCLRSFRVSSNAKS